MSERERELEALGYPLDQTTPEGKLVEFIPVPKDESTNCAFGGPDLKTLYITSGGSLFSIRTKTAGIVSGQ